VLPVIARATPVYDSAGQRIGEVEALELDQATSRITRIIVRRGLLFTLANMTREWSAYVLDVAVPYREDPDRVVEIPPPMPRSERGTVARSGDLTPK
jgi:sporulation protein YlmC with PRC-barrel domain